ncbi:salivary glue protein Sgs-3-like [Haliotis asinina]|uniref:salivary glue protein Sgs-3-like n=1 Tax=Haliotis asinina TaxID=109174 RepID=UPI003531C54F
MRTIILMLTVSSVSSDWLSQMGGERDKVLPGYVYQIFQTGTVGQCYRLCVYSARCASANWISSTDECQLSTSAVGSLQVSTNNVYLPIHQFAEQNHPCADAPCGADHVCVPVSSSSHYVCAHVKGYSSNSATPSVAATTLGETTRDLTTSSSPLPTTTISTTTQTSTTALPPPSTSVPPKTTLASTTTTTSPTTTSTPPTTTPPTTTPAPTTTTPLTTTPPTTTTSPTTTTPSTTTPAPTTTTPVPTTTPSPVTTTPTTTTPLPTTTTPTTTTHDGTCTTDSDCSPLPFTSCSDNLCVCIIGSDTDTTIGMCRSLTECSSLASDFSSFEDMAITDLNIETITGKTPAQCAQLCIDTSSFVCKSYEMYFSTCLLQNVSWYDVPEGGRGYKKRVDHYQRRCNW